MPVKKAAFEAVVSTWPMTCSDMPKPRKSPAATPSRKKEGVGGRRGRAEKMSNAARRKRKERNASGGASLRTFLTTIKEEPQMNVTPTRTRSARSLSDRGSEVSDIQKALSYQLSARRPDLWREDS